MALSVVLHGFSARPFATWHGRYAERLRDDAPEFVGDDEPRHKGRALAMHDEMLDLGGMEDH